ncbi:MAG: di-heme oxidoredictase family protein, partial [Pseudomonadota bacterium]
ISGRPNMVMSAEYGTEMLGRFGVRATAPTLKAQAAGAFNADIGIASPLEPAPAGDCTAAQPACLNAPHGMDAPQGGFEVSGEGLDLVTFYTANLAVPKRARVGDPEVLRGKELFYEAECTSCHVPKFVTARLPDRPENSFQLIWPHSDFLLHDMGPGLADGLPAGGATGAEWRTAPLWGLGLTEQVAGHRQFLHDGRARSLTEAILWHGGEAQGPRDTFAGMPAPDRAALIAFLESL